MGNKTAYFSYLLFIGFTDQYPFERKAILGLILLLVGYILHMPYNAKQVVCVCKFKQVYLDKFQASQQVNLKVYFFVVHE